MSMYIGEALEVIIKKLNRLESLYEMLVEKESANNAEEVSMARVCRILHRGAPAIEQMVKDKILPARKYKDSSGKLRYRFKMSDLHKYQYPELYDSDNAEAIKEIRARKKEQLKKEENEELKCALEDLKSKVFGVPVNKQKQGTKKQGVKKNEDIKKSA